MENQKPLKESVKNGKKNPRESTQLHLQIAEIRDNAIVLKNGGMRAVLKSSSINLNLKSEDEQNAVIFSYQNFLNQLEFPIQVVIRSKKLDIDNYIEKLEKLGVAQTNPLMQKQTFEYIEYVSRLVEYADIMEKEFYVVIPQDPFRAEKKGFIKTFLEHIMPQDNLAKIKQRHSEFDTLKKSLGGRVNTVRAGLENCNLKVTELNTQELIELFYQVYNPMTSRNQKFGSGEDLALEQDKADENINTTTVQAPQAS